MRKWVICIFLYLYICIFVFVHCCWGCKVLCTFGKTSCCFVLRLDVVFTRPAVILPRIYYKKMNVFLHKTLSSHSAIMCVATESHWHILQNRLTVKSYYMKLIFLKSKNKRNFLGYNKRQRYYIYRKCPE